MKEDGFADGKGEDLQSARDSASQLEHSYTNDVRAILQSGIAG
jgi:hypothetical protein